MRTLQELVTHLLMAAHAYTGYTVPAESPEVRFVPQVEIQQMACDRPCKVYGWYPHGKTIYLDDWLDPVHDGAGDGPQERIQLEEFHARCAERRSADPNARADRIV